MQTSAFFNSKDGDRRYKAEDFSEFFAAFIANGVFPNPPDSLRITATGGMKIQVGPGMAWINGYFFKNRDNETFTLDYADSALTRVDRVVVRWSLAERSITLQVKKGKPSLPPQQGAALERSAEIYELALADIRVEKGVAAVTPANISDLRLDSALCGIVRGTVEEIDTTTLYNRFESWYSTFTSEESENFRAWFDSIRDILDESVAASLLSKIDALDKSTAEKIGALESGKAAKAHTHSAADISSGALPIAHGGTGGASAEAARSNLGLLPGVQGIWTPTMLDGNPTYTRNVGSYLKVGRMVFITFSLQFKPRAAASRIFITGLPFTSDADVGLSSGGFKLNCPKLPAKFVPNGILMFANSDTCGIYVLDTTAPQNTQSPSIAVGETYEVTGFFGYYARE